MSDPAPYLARIADALERLAPPPLTLDRKAEETVFIWDGAAQALEPVAEPRRVPLDLLLGADDQKSRLVTNTHRFAAGQPANHALLWGARGTGKSALVKAVHASVSQTEPSLKLIEISRSDLEQIPALATALATAGWRAILFIDDLSFERGDEAYKALKSILDGGVSGSFDRLLVYVTSNRRHLLNRAVDHATDFRPEETQDEQVALSERFGLWLGFYPMDQPTWLAIVQSYCAALDLAADDTHLERTALQWAAQRGNRSGRSAWQFIIERAGALGRSVSFNALAGGRDRPDHS
jgi:uncharacterized protein